MAEGKKSFVLYADIEEMLNELPDDVAGKLFKTIIAYVNDKNPIVEDVLLKVSFAPIKAQLKRDLIKYETKKVQYSEAGKASAEAKRLKKLTDEQQPPTDSTNVEERSTKSTVNVNDSVSVNDTVNDIKDIEGVKPLPKTLEERKKEFGLSLEPHLNKYGRPMLTAFFKHWSEHNEGGKKMLFEMKKTFSLSGRLATWKANEAKFDKKPAFNNNQQPTIKSVPYDEQ